MNQLKKILHIDDDAVIRMMVKKSLERSQKGFEFISCETAHEFLDLLPSFEPQLLLIDIHMPTMDGPRLLRETRKRGIHTPAIFMTGQDEDIENKEFLEPIIGIIKKPFSPLKLGDDIISMWLTVPHDYPS